MGSHHDDDFGNTEMNSAIRKLFEDKADQMTDRRLNLITAGEPGESALYEETVDGLILRHMPDDPLALRISIGEPHELDEGAYCVFRGKPSETIGLLERALAAIKNAHAHNAAKSS